MTSTNKTFLGLIEKEKTICASFDPHDRTSWEYLKNELKPLFDIDFFKDHTPILVIIPLTKAEN